MILKKSALAATAAVLFLGLSPAASADNSGYEAMVGPTYVSAIMDFEGLKLTFEKSNLAEINAMNQTMASFQNTLLAGAAAKQKRNYLDQTMPQNQLGGGQFGPCLPGTASHVATAPVAPNNSSVPAVAGGSKTVSTDTVADQNKKIVDQAEKGKGIDIQALFNKKYSDDDVLNLVNALVSPKSPPTLNDSQKKQGSGVVNTSNTNIVRANLSLARSSLNAVAQDNRPLPAVSTEDLAQIAAVFNIKTPIVAPVSRNELMEDIVKGVYANADWQNWLQQADETGAWRAYALMKAVEAQQDDRQQQLLEQLSALSAAHMSKANQVMAESTNAGRNAAIIQNGRGE